MPGEWPNVLPFHPMRQLPLCSMILAYKMEVIKDYVGLNRRVLQNWVGENDSVAGCFFIKPHKRGIAMMRVLATSIIFFAMFVVMPQAEANCTTINLGTVSITNCSDGRSSVNLDGTTTFHSSSDGTSGSSVNLDGTTTFHGFSDGTSGSSVNLDGTTTFHGFSDGTSGSSVNLDGTTTFHGFSDGTSGSSVNLDGTTTFHNFSDGTSGSSVTLGGTTLHNVNKGTSAAPQLLDKTGFLNQTNRKPSKRNK